MDKQLRDILFEELKKRGVSVYRFSRLTGIPEGRIKAWKRGDGNPKDKDATIIKEWIGQAPTLPKIGKEDSLNYTFTMTAEQRVAELLRDKEILRDAIQLSLNSIQDRLSAIQEDIQKRSEGIDDVLYNLQKNQDSVTPVIMSVSAKMDILLSGMQKSAGAKSSGKGRVSSKSK